MKKRISTRSVFFVFIFAIIALSAIVLFRHFRLTANQEALLNPTESIAASPFAQDTVLAPNPSVENSEVLPNTGTPTIGVYAVSASNIWVDSKTGNDANNGQSPDKAYRTIQKAASVAGPGATIHIMPGVYRESIRPGMSGTVSAPIRYIAEKGPGTVIIRGSEPASSLGWTQLTSNSIGLPSGVNPANIYSTDLSAWGLKSPPRCRRASQIGKLKPNGRFPSFGGRRTADQGSPDAIPRPIQITSAIYPIAHSRSLPIQQMTAIQPVSSPAT
jgi:hypothetical protein